MKVYHKLFGSDFIMSCIAVCIVVGLVCSGISALNGTKSSFQSEFSFKKI